MIQIRAGVFETNSSSTHSLCIMTQDDFNKWVSSHNGEYYFVGGDGCGYAFNHCFADGVGSGIYDKETVKQAIENYAQEYEKKYKDEEWYTPVDVDMLEHSDDEEVESSREDSRLWDLGIYTYEDWCRYNDELERYETSFTTPSGDDMIAFGAYGYRQEK